MTIDWTAVDALTYWRFGLASALGVTIPQSLLDSAPPSYEAWLARAPMLSAANRVAPARIAATLGPISSAALVDLYGRVMDEAGEEDRESPSAQLRAAFRGDDVDARLSAMHVLWDAAANGEGVSAIAMPRRSSPPAPRQGSSLRPIPMMMFHLSSRRCSPPGSTNRRSAGPRSPRG